MLLVLVWAIRSAQCHQQKYNVVRFHAAADGKTDDSQVAAAQRQNFFFEGRNNAKICIASCISDFLLYLCCQKAFLATWQAACSDQARPIMVIPGRRTFLLSEVTFQGPCKSPITIQVTTIPIKIATLPDLGFYVMVCRIKKISFAI